MNYALAAPAAGTVHPLCRKSLLHAVLLAERRGYHMVADHSVFGTHLIAMRNEVHRLAVQDPERNYDGVVWVDADIVLPQDAIARLLSHKKDFVTGIYFQRGGDYGPALGEFREVGSGRFGVWLKKDLELGKGLVKLPGGACGFGLCYTSVELLKEFPAVRTGAVGGPFERIPFIPEPGEDFSFCWRVRERGGDIEDAMADMHESDLDKAYEDISLLTLHADTDLLVGHMGDGQIVTYADWLEGKKGASNAVNTP